MRWNRDIDALRSHPRYPYAVEMLQEILRGQVPSRRNLGSLYGPGSADMVRELVAQHLAAGPSRCRTLRRQEAAAPTEISDKRVALESEPGFQRVQLELLSLGIPEVSLLKVLYGDYAAVIRRVYREFLRRGLR
ncbi:MAG: hypothetical protein WB626_00635, partial [Bacteroidota bacterium]